MRRPFRPGVPKKVPAKPPVAKKLPPKKPEVKAAAQVKKPAVKLVKKPSRKKKKKQDVFKRLSKIAREERQGQIKNRLKSLKVSEAESKQRLAKLKKQLKIK